MTDRELFADYYTEADVAKLLGITVPTLRNRISAGKDFPPFAGHGNGKRFPKDEFKKWEQRQLVRQVNRAS